MRVNVAIPEAHVNEHVLDAALEAVTTLNEAMIKNGDAPTFDQALRNGVKWKPEPPGAEHFDHAGIVSARGWGDCDDLAPHHAATLRVKGVDPGARAIVVRSGPSMWHAVVQRSDGKLEDPSEAAGMRSNHAIKGAALPLMSAPQTGVNGAYILRPQLALRPTPNGWQARTDLPWNWHPQGTPSPTDFAMSALHQAPIAATALNGSLDHAIALGEVCGGAADEEHLERLRCLSDHIAGMPLHELAEEYGHEHARAAHQVVGSFWSHLKHLASPIAHLATSPLSMASHLAHGQFGKAFGDLTAPAQAAMHLAQPFGHALSPFSGLMRMVPGIGPIAASAVDLANHGMPTSFGDLAHFAMQQGGGMIPGVGPMLQQTQQPQGWPTMGF
jgi:hypothetical protein